MFEIVKTTKGYASTPTTLIKFNGSNGAFPLAELIIDAAGNLFGTTESGGANNAGTAFKIAKITSGYSSTPTTLVSFCSQANCADGGDPAGALVADAQGNLFGTTTDGGAENCNGDASGCGTVFEITESGFAVSASATFAGTPGKANCFGQSVSELAQKYGGLNNAAAALGYDSVGALQDAIQGFCAG